MLRRQVHFCRKAIIFQHRWRRRILLWRKELGKWDSHQIIRWKNKRNWKPIIKVGHWRKNQCPTLISVYHSVCNPEIHRVLQVLWSQSWLLYFCSSCWAVSSVNYRLHRLYFYWYSFLWEDFLNPCILSFLFTSSFYQIIYIAVLKNKLFCSTLVL